MLLKKRSLVTLLFFLLFFTLIFLFMFQPKVFPGEETLNIYTSFYPLYFAANQIAGDRMLIHSVIPNGAEVHSFEPSPRRIASLEAADVFFYIGLGMEPWGDRVVANLKDKGVRTVRVSSGLELIEMKNKFSESKSQQDLHDGLNEARDEKGEIDPHVWLDPLNMKEIGRVIKEELVKLDPQNKDYYQKNYQEFSRKLESLHQEFKTALAGKKRDYILVSHAAFGYLGNRYGFQQLAVTGISPHGEPSPGTIAELIKQAREDGIKYIFKETLASPRTVEVLVNEVGLEVLTLNPIAGLTPEEQESNQDYFTLMRKNLENLKKGLVN